MEELKYERVKEIKEPKKKGFSFKQKKKNKKSGEKNAKSKIFDTKKKKIIGVILLILLFWIGIMCGYLVYSFNHTPKIIDENVLGNDEFAGVNRQDGIYTFLVCGKDKVALNTDTILVFSLDTANNSLNTLSIPRDTMSNVSRYVKKINAAYGSSGKGNIEDLKKEVTMLLGINIDRYVLVNLDAFEDVIDAIGGVTIDVKQDMNYNDPYQNLSIHINKGEQTLNGKNAVGFVRYRSGYANGDLGRVEAQQQFIQALLKKLKSPAIISKIPALADIVKKNMDTDLTAQEMIWFAQEGLDVDLSSGLNILTLPGAPAYIYNGRQNLSYYVPNKTEILEMVNEYFNPYDKEITANMVDIVDKSSLESAKSSSSSKKDVVVDDVVVDENIKVDDNTTQNDDKVDNNANENTSNGNDNANETTSNESVGPTDIITDKDGNMYEIDVNTGKVLKVIPNNKPSVDNNASSENSGDNTTNSNNSSTDDEL